MTLLRAAAATHTGYVRATNQDLALVSGDLVAVADGMGGHLGGEVAARTAIEELLSAFQSDRSGTGLVRAVRKANRTIWKKSRVERTLHGMGTTLTAAALVPGGEDSDRFHLALVNIGDSRAYALDHDTGELRQLTEDHSVVEEMVRQGELTPEEAAVHPHRHVLTRALGIDAEAEVDVWDLEPVPGSRFLLCSDGLTNELTASEIGEILASEAEPEDAARELVGRALGHGGIDNVTVVVLDVLDEAADSKDTRVALVPARAPEPEMPPGEARDITEAIPITTPASTELPDGSAEVEIAWAQGLARDEADDRGGGTGAEGSSTGSAAAEALTAAGVAAAAAGIAPSSAAGVAAEGAGTAAVAGGAAAAVAGAAERGAGASGRSDRPDHSQATEAVPQIGGGERRRTGRSMTVRSRGTPAALEGASGLPVNGQVAATSAGTGPLGAGGGSPNRPIVLVRRGKERARDRIVTFRVAVFMILIAAVAAGTGAVVLWYNQSKYYVGLDGNVVAIYQGRPGGMLWFKPRLLVDSPLTTRQLLPAAVPALRAGLTVSTEKDAEQVVSALTNSREKLQENLTKGIYQVPPSTGPEPTFVTTTTAPSFTSTTSPGQTTTSTSGPVTTTTSGAHGTKKGHP